MKKILLMFASMLIGMMQGNAQARISVDTTNREYFNLVNGDRKIGPFSVIKKDWKTGLFYCQGELVTKKNDRPYKSYSKWFCIDSTLQVKLSYPGSYRWVGFVRNGISKVAKACVGDCVGIGAVDTCGRFLFEPKHRDVWGCGNDIWGAGLYGDSDGKQHPWDEVFIFKKAYSNLPAIRCKAASIPIEFESTADQIFSLHSDKVLERYLVKEDLLQDEKEFIRGYHYFLNFRFKEAKRIFKNVSKNAPEVYEAAQFNISSINKTLKKDRRLITCYDKRWISNIWTERR